MKKLLLFTMLIGAMPSDMLAQDDLYFVPNKKADQTTDKYGMPKDTYYVGSNRSVDEYNRRRSSYEVIEGDTAKNDIIEFSAVQGVYPDSLKTEDFEMTKNLSRFDDYDVSDNSAFWAGYRAGRDTWGWHSPWYYSRFGWYDPWYSPWYGSYYWRWYDPWYYGYGGWYDPWYGWGYPYYRPYYVWYVPSYRVGGRGHSYIGTGSHRRDGSTYANRGIYRSGYGQRGSTAGSHSNSSLRRKMNALGGSRSRTGSSYRPSYNGSYGSRSSGSYSGGSRSSGSYGGGSSSFGGSRGGGGGGGRLGGRR